MGCNSLGISGASSAGCHSLGISVELQVWVSFPGNKCGASSVGCHSLGISAELQVWGVILWE